MTFEIGLVLAILAIAVVLFISEKLRVDVVAVLVLVLLALTGLVTPQEALSGFSNPAVITVWAVFILSGALSRTGIAGLVGRHVLSREEMDRPLPDAVAVTGHWTKYGALYWIVTSTTSSNSPGP